MPTPFAPLRDWLARRVAARPLLAVGNGAAVAYPALAPVPPAPLPSPVAAPPTSPPPSSAAPRPEPSSTPPPASAPVAAPLPSPALIESLRQQRATVQAMLDSVEEMIAMISPAGAVLAINAFGAAQFGLESGQVIGRPITQLFHPSEARPIARALAQTLRDGTPHREEITWRRRAVELSVHPVRDPAGRIVALTMLARDIGERKRAEATLRTLSRAVEHSPAILIITDPAGVIEYVNPRFQEVFGYGLEEVIGRTPALLRSDDLADSDYAQMWRQLNIGERWSGRFRNRRKDGSLVWISASISPVRTEDGRVSHFVSLQEDISEQVAAEEEARESERQLRRYMRIAAMGEMAAALAHELNQPIAAAANYCNGASRRLANGADAAQLSGVIGEIGDEVRRASRIIQHIARFVREAPQQRHATELAKPVRAIVELAERDLGRHGARVELGFAEESLPVEINAVEIEQLLLNLLRNAADAMAAVPPEARRITVRCERRDAERARVSIADRGPGFDEKALARAFEPFFTTKRQGMGMGLAICRSIVEAHGGQICAENGADGGAVVHFTLPLIEVSDVAS